jgi:hypothetical protein
MGWKPVGCVGERRRSYRTFAVNVREKDYLADLGISWKKILKCIFKN